MYIRMISKKAKWEQDKSKSNINDTSADIITNCLKTSNETLSLWYVEKEEEIDKAIIALSSNRDFVNRLDYIIIPDEYIIKYKLELGKTNGESPYTEFNGNHFDIINVKYGVLGVVSKMIFDIIVNNGKIVRVPESEIKNKLISAINQNILNINAIKQTLLEEVQAG